MDGHGEYSSLERSRLLRSGLDGVPGGGGARSGINLPTIGEFTARAATPTTLTLAQYHSRFGLPSAMPGSNFAFMGSLLSGAHSPEASKALLIDFQHYWSAHADNFPRYLMTRGLYPSYPPLLPGTAESLSLLGAGVACVAGGASTAAGPSQPHHLTHYQRLLEMQKEAYLASVSAANHHQALYGIGATPLPPFLEQAPVSAHPATPLSLVKQEPREVPCTEKVAKQNERRGMGFKVDQDLNRGSRDTFLSSSSLGSVQLKEPKLSPSISAGRSEKKGSSSSTAPGSSNSHHKRSSTHSSANSNSTRQYSDNVRSKCTSPSNRLVPPSSALISPKSANSSGTKTSLNVSKQTKTSTYGYVPSCGNNLKTTSPSSALFSEPPVISVPTQAAAPIPLATVQHDGVVLSALASPSSAAASSASSKPTILKQQTDKLSRSNGDKDPADVMKSVLEASTTPCGLSNRQVDGEQCFDRNSSHNKSDGTESRDISVGNMDSCSVASENKTEDKQLSDDNSDIVVDSTESDDIPTTACSPPVPKSDQDRAVEETIEKVASTVDSLMETDVDCPTSPHCSKNSPDHANSPLVSATRKEISCIVTSSGSPLGTRTVYAKTASVSAVTVSGCVQLTSTIATQASTSALPYYDTLYCKPEGVRRVHATTFVPEVGIFKGPSTKGLNKIPSSPSPSGTRTLSPESRYKLDPRFTGSIFSLPSEGHTRARESTPSPLLLSPSRDLTSHSMYNASASPGTAHTNTEISSSLDSVSLDSASVRSHSVASFHSAPDADDSDETSDENDNDLVIDDDVQSTQGDYSKSKKCSLQNVDSDTNDNITLKKNGDEICSNVSICAEVELGRCTPIKAVKDNVHIISDVKVNDTSNNNSFVTLESKVPCDLSDRMCCDEAIDYSLPKSSFSELIDDAPNLLCHMSSRTSYPFQSSPTSKLRHSLYNARRHIHNARTVGAKDSVQALQKTHKSLPKSLPRSCTQCPINTTKIISSPTKPLIRNAIVSSLRGSLTAPGSSHKRLKPNSENATSQGVLSNVARRLMEEQGITRCGSAPPATNLSSIKPLKISLFQSQDSLSCRDMEHHDRNDGPSEHNLGNIPVGIAVAQIRPHQIQQSREFRASDNASRDVRLGQVSASTKTITQTTTTMAAPATALAPSLMVAGRTGSWLQQMPFPLHQTMNSSGTTFDPSFPITAPSGFKFAHDSLTGQFFIVPTGEFVEQGGVWPPAGFVAATGLGTTHYQTNVAHPTITIHGPEEREVKSKTENGAGKITETITDKLICAQETISKDRTGLTRGDGKHHPNIVEGSNGSSTQGVITTATAVMVNPMTNISYSSPPPLLKIERPTVESRGCSPIVIEDVSLSLSLSSKLPSLASQKISTITVGVQTCDSLMQSSHDRNSSPPKIVAHDQAIQISPSELSVLKPLSVQCPDLDSVDSLTNTPEVKTNLERTSYNPFTDPQILQAADGLELLSTLAEKRTKCSSLDDPKRIFPSPSDSFKSDSASIVAIEDTLSPDDVDFKSGQCTPRREVRRDLSPKWSLSRKEKEPQTLSVFADFKAPPDVEILEDSEVRVKLAEVQRQYKEKQKELAKLQNKRNEDNKKRGPGRPPKKKTHSKKSDEDSSSCSSKTKEHHHHHQQHKKKRPAEELVDRVFRKLPPLIKPGKVSRSIHYVKSKTGPFFRRKSASSSVKRNKDLFGFDESNWPSFSERKHQEKVKNAIKAFSGKSKSKHRISSNQSVDSKHSHDAGNIFANLESFGGDYRRELLQKHHSSHRHGKSLSTSGTVCIKTEPCSTAHQESGLGLLAKFALTVTTSSLSTCSVSLPLTSTSSISTASSSNQSSVNSFSTGTFSSSSIYCTSLYNTCSSMYNMSSTNSGRSAPNLTFGSLSSIMSSAGSGLMSFNNPNLTSTSVTNNSTIMTSASVFTTTPLVSTTSAPVSMSPITSAVTVSITHAAPLFPSPGAYQSSTEESSSGASSSSSGSTNFSSSSCATSSSGAIRDISPVKHKHEDDSDTDTSDTSPNKKRKPGRPRKINPEKSSGGTETIWAKKSSTIGLLQVTEPNSSQAKEGSIRKLDQNAMKPLFLDEEWTRRRSERIFLNEPSPLPSPAITPPRESWKLANFMPKSKKVLDASKSTTEDKGNTDTFKEQSPTVNLGPAKSSTFSVLSLSSSVTIKSEGKELTSLISTPAKPVPCKNTEISVPRVEDAKMIVRLEDSTTKLPFLLSSSLMSSSPCPEKIRKICKEDGPFKNKKLTPLSVISSSSLSPPPPTLEKKEKRAKEHSKIKLQKAKSLHDLTQRVKKKYSKAVLRKQRDEQSKKDSRHCKKKRKISTDSSDNDNLPLVLYRDGPPTPEPRSCKLQLSDLREGLKVLYLIDGLFHEGTVKALQPPDVYGVLTAGQRGNRPHILCLEEILKWAVLDVHPRSIRYLPEGTRVCAFWSQQFSCLYPGTVSKSSPVNNGKKVVVPVEFDDGDNGRIELDHIRLLPADFPIVEYEPDPLEVLPKRKQRTASDASDLRKSMDAESNTSKNKDDDDEDDGQDEDNDDDDEEEVEENEDNDNDDGYIKDDEDSDVSDTMVKHEPWRWEGKCTKRPGLKGKAKKTFYKAISRDKEVIKVGDSAVFVSRDRANCPYIGRIESLWQGWNGQMMVKVHWYYHPEETQSEKKLSDPKNALFESQHEDENDIQTIAYKCEVLPLAQYKKQLNKATTKGQSLKSSVFYVAGFYDPTAKQITFYPGVS